MKQASPFQHSLWRFPPAVWRLGIVLTLIGLVVLIGHLIYDDHADRRLVQQILLEEARTIAPLLVHRQSPPLKQLGQAMERQRDDGVVVVVRIELWDERGETLLWTKTRPGAGNLGNLPAHPGPSVEATSQELEGQWFVATAPIPGEQGVLRLIGHRSPDDTRFPALGMVVLTFLFFPLSWWTVAWLFNQQRLRDEQAIAALLESLSGSSTPERSGHNWIGTLIRRLRLRILHIAHRIEIQQAALTLYRTGPIPERAVAQALEPFLAVGGGHQALVTGGAMLLMGHDDAPTLRIAWSSDPHLHSETPIPLLDMDPLDAVQHFEPLQDPDRGQLILPIPLPGQKAPAGFLVLFGHDQLGTVEDEWNRFTQHLGVLLQRWEALQQQTAQQRHVLELFHYSEHPTLLLEERGRILDLNRAGERFLQKGRLEIAGLPLFKVLPEEAQEIASQVIRQLQIQRRVEPRPLMTQGNTPWSIAGERIEGTQPLLVLKLQPRHTWVS